MKVQVPVDTNIYLKLGKKLRIPVNPETIEISHPTINKTHDVLGVGEIVVPMKPGLSEISWESFFPGDDADPYVGDFTEPETLVKQIQKAIENASIGRVVITRSRLFDTNMRCIVEDFTLKDRGGEPNDIYYSITLKEYRDYSPETVTIVQEIAQEDAPADKVIEATTETERPVETPVVRVGASVIANGTYCNDEYGSKPHGTASGLSTTITRINPGTPYPIHIGYYGWMQESDLQIVG